MNDIPNWLVVVLGVCIVFVGLICIIALCKVMSLVVKLLEKKEAPVNATAAPAAPAALAPIQNKQEIVAAVCAAVAEDLGTDVSGIQVLSFKRV